MYSNGKSFWARYVITKGCLNSLPLHVRSYRERLGFNVDIEIIVGTVYRLKIIVRTVYLPGDFCWYSEPAGRLLLGQCTCWEIIVGTVYLPGDFCWDSVPAGRFLLGQCTCWEIFVGTVYIASSSSSPHWIKFTVKGKNGSKPWIRKIVKRHATGKRPLYRS